MNIIIMRGHSDDDTVQVKYHGYSNWTHWVEAETRQSTALYLSTNIGTGAAIGGISNIDLTLIFPRIGIMVSVPRIEPPPPVTLLPVLVTLAVILVTVILLSVCVVTLVRRSQVKYDEVRRTSSHLLHSHVQMR